MYTNPTGASAPPYPTQPRASAPSHSTQPRASVPSPPLMEALLHRLVSEAPTPNNVHEAKAFLQEVHKYFGKTKALSQLYTGLKFSITTCALCALGYLVASLAAGFFLQAYAITAFAAIAGILSSLFLIEAAYACFTHSVWRTVNHEVVNWIESKGTTSEEKLEKTKETLLRLAGQADSADNFTIRNLFLDTAEKLGQGPEFGLMAAGSLLLTGLGTHMVDIALFAGRAAAQNKNDQPARNGSR